MEVIASNYVTIYVIYDSSQCEITALAIKVYTGEANPVKFYRPLSIGATASQISFVMTMTDTAPVSPTHLLDQVTLLQVFVPAVDCLNVEQPLSPPVVKNIGRSCFKDQASPCTLAQFLYLPDDGTISAYLATTTSLLGDGQTDHLAGDELSSTPTEFEHSIAFLQHLNTSSELAHHSFTAVVDNTLYMGERVTNTVAASSIEHVLDCSSVT